MTLWSSPHPKDSTALSLGQAQQSSEIGKIKDFVGTGSVMPMPSSAASFPSDNSEDAGFEDGSVDVDMGEGEEETDSIQIDCIQTLTEYEPMNEGELRVSSGSPIMTDSKTPIPLPPPPIHVGSGAYGGNQAYSNLQNTLPQIMDRPSSPLPSYWGSNSASESTVYPSRAPGDVGLNNIGNTCFMNSGLQCLVHTSPLVEFFVGSDSYEKTTTSLVYQFNSLMNHVWFGDKGAISLHDFKLVLGNKYGQFKDCRQHDCQEFLAVMLDMLHEELKSRRQSISFADSSVSEASIDICVAAEKSEAQDTQKEEAFSKNEAYSCDDIVTQSSDMVADKVPGNNNKRLKLEKSEEDECDSAAEAAVKRENKEPAEVKRKYPFSKPGISYKPATQTSEVQETPIHLKSTENDTESFHERDDSPPQMVSPIIKAQTYWDEYMKENNTVIASTFQGMFKSAVTCSECSFISETYEPFMYLSLPIPRVMEKQLNVTFISMKDRNQVRTEVTVHLMGSVGNLIQQVVKTLDHGDIDAHTKYAAAEVFNHRVSRVLDEKLQLRNLSTNSRNIYVYELNNNFDDDNNNGIDVADSVAPKSEDEKCSTLSDVGGRLASNKLKDWRDKIEANSAEASTSSSMPTYTPFGAPVGGGVYDIATSSTTQGVTSSSDGAVPPQDDNDNFNRVQCNICLEDYSRSSLKKHRGCSCVLCEECLSKSVEHFQTEGVQTQEGDFLRCAVCLQVVNSKKTFFSLEESFTNSSPPEFILMSVLFRNDPGTDANNNSSWISGLFSYPWLIRVPSYLNAADLVEYIESINPAPEANHRLLSVKSDGKSCGHCIFPSRCNGCEIPKDGMISLNSSNSILISFTDLPSEQMEQMQPPDMIVHSELSSSWQYNRHEEPTIDIHDCLRTFSETEHLDEQNPWYCPRCAKNQRATKALSICKFPDYLIIYLKRFVYLDQSSNKLNNRLTFPINDLDVSDYVTEGFGADIGNYNLYSCVCHFGSASAGHYTAYAKNPASNKWHYFNDDSIVERAPGDNEYASAYVLFYEKQGMECNIPMKCSRPLPDLNSFSSSSTFTADTKGVYLPSEMSVPAGPVRVDGDFNEVNLQVDSTSTNFSFPHPSTEADLLNLEVDEGVGNESNHLAEIRNGLGLGENEAVAVTSSTSGAEEESFAKDQGLDFDKLEDADNTISTSTQDLELPSSSVGGADSTSI